MSTVTLYTVNPLSLLKHPITKIEDGPVVYPANFAFDSRLRGD